LSLQMIPALTTDIVCCSVASCIDVRSSFDMHLELVGWMSFRCPTAWRCRHYTSSHKNSRHARTTACGRKRSLGYVLEHQLFRVTLAPFCAHHTSAANGLLMRRAILCIESERIHLHQAMTGTPAGRGVQLDMAVGSTGLPRRLAITLAHTMQALPDQRDHCHFHSRAGLPCPPPLQSTFHGRQASYGNDSSWTDLSCDGDGEWIRDSLVRGTLCIAHDGSYMANKSPCLCSAGVIFYCLHTDSWLKVSVSERSDVQHTVSLCEKYLVLGSTTSLATSNYVTELLSIHWRSW
jgi:hypothetical protein